MDLRRQIAIVRRWLPLLGACVLLAGIAAYEVSNLQQKVYEAKATLIVGQSLSSVNPNYNQLLASQTLSTTYASIATTRPILNDVIGRLSLTVSSDELAKHVQASAALDSTLLTITTQDPDPAQAAAIANAVADELIAASPAIQGRVTDLQQFIQADLTATQEQITATQAEIARLGSLASPKPTDVTELDTLQGRLTTLQATYATLLSISSDNASNLLSVVEPAVPPTSPVAPRPLFNALLAATVGLLLGAAIVFVVEYLDDRLKSAEEVEGAVGLPTLGLITRMRHNRGSSEIYRLAALVYPRSVVAESYRTLRTNIEFAAVDRPVRTLLVTSAIPGEGKTVTAANIAVVFAQAGRQVILVDADLRKPGIHLLFDLPNSQGLTSLLRTDEVTLGAVAQTTDQANLRIVTTGPLPPNPAELLGSQRMRTVLERLQVGDDLVVFDSPPVQAVADAAILSSYLDATLFVIDARHSHRGAVRQARQSLAKAGAAVLGVVLNRTQGTNSSYGGYYGDERGVVAAADTHSRATEKSPKRAPS